MPSRRRRLAPAAFLSILLAMGASACSDDAKSQNGNGRSVDDLESSSEAQPADEEFDPETATNEERWAECIRLVSEEGLSKEFWVANSAEQAVKPSYMGQVCGRTLEQEVGGLDLMSLAYDMDELEMLNRGTVLFDQIYCPEKAAQVAQAWEEYESQGLKPPKPRDFSIKLKIRRQQCFGSAGCNVTFQIDPTYDGPSDLAGKYDVTYEVLGVDSGPYINTFQMKNGNASFDVEEQVSTPPGGTLTAKVIRVDKG